MEEGSGERMKGGVHSVVLYKVEGKEEEMDETNRGWNVWGDTGARLCILAPH